MPSSPLHLPSDAEMDSYFTKLEKTLMGARTRKKLYHEIANAPFCDKYMTTRLGLGIVVFLKVNPETNTIDRISLSDTEPAKGAVQMSAKRFDAIKIPLDNKKNIIAKTIRSGRSHKTDDWQYLFIPDLTPEQARFNQAGAGIDGSIVYPVSCSLAKGALIFSYFQQLPKLSEAANSYMDRYAALVCKALQALADRELAGRSA